MVKQLLILTTVTLFTLLTGCDKGEQPGVVEKMEKAAGEMKTEAVEATEEVIDNTRELSVEAMEALSDETEEIVDDAEEALDTHADAMSAPDTNMMEDMSMDMATMPEPPKMDMEMEKMEVKPEL